MKRGVIFWLLFVSGAAFGQAPLLNKLWSTSNSNEGLSTLQARANQIVAHQQKKNSAHDLRSLHQLFRNTQKRILHNYEAYAGIDQLEEGKYDCLTATGLFTSLLQEAGFQFEIVETNYHIFLLVHTSEGDALLETTDRQKGLVVDPSEIRMRLGSYQQQKPQLQSYQFRNNICHRISADNLVGLLWFNQAVKAYNAKNLVECANKLTLAWESYPDNSRIAEMASILLYSVSFSPDLSQSEKDNIKSRFRQFDGFLGLPVATR